MTQCHSGSSRAPKHEGYDRTGDWTTRVKITQDLEHEINDGLEYYQDDLWHRERTNSESYKTVTIISQADFEKIAPPAPKIQNQEVPPPPPPMHQQQQEYQQQEEIPQQPQLKSESIPESSSQNNRRQKPVYRGPRFYAVTKDDGPDPRTPRKRKTRHSINPPVEHHVGWIMDVKEHRPRTSSAG